MIFSESPEGVTQVLHLSLPDKQMSTLLARAEDSWHFDAFELDMVTSGHGLSCLGYYLVCKAGLLRRFNLSKKAFARWV